MSQEVTQPKGFVVREPLEVFGTGADPYLHIVLVAPEIPGNTGNVGRLCAGTNIWLHLVRPLGFELSNKHLRRAGLDYWPHVQLCVHEDFAAIEAIFSPERMHLFSAKGTEIYTERTYLPGSALVFGRETKGLGDEIRERYADRLTLIPKTGAVRSLNLSNAVAIAAYEAMRQLDWGPMTSSS